MEQHEESRAHTCTGHLAGFRQQTPQEDGTVRTQLAMSGEATQKRAEPESQVARATETAKMLAARVRGRRQDKAAPRLSAAQRTKSEAAERCQKRRDAPTNESDAQTRTPERWEPSVPDAQFSTHMTMFVTASQSVRVSSQRGAWSAHSIRRRNRKTRRKIFSP